MPNAEEIVIIEGLRAGGLLRRRYENILWQKFSGFIKWGTARYQLETDDIRLAYDDAICSVITNIITGKYEENAQALLKTYAEAIFHRKCLDLLDRSNDKHGASSVAKKNIKKPQPFSDGLINRLPHEVKNTIEKLIEQEERLMLLQCLEKIGATCKQILMLFGGNYRDKEIATLMHYNSPDVAKQSRYRCLEKLSELYFSMHKHE